MKITDEELAKFAAGERMAVPGETWAVMARELLTRRRAMDNWDSDASADENFRIVERELIGEGVLDERSN